MGGREPGGRGDDPGLRRVPADESNNYIPLDLGSGSVIIMI